MLTHRPGSATLRPAPAARETLARVRSLASCARTLRASRYDLDDRLIAAIDALAASAAIWAATTVELVELAG
jgi:hypothetical protein